MNHRFLGLAILVYVVFCQLYDLHRHGPTAYYSYFWVCTVSMLTAAMGLLMNSETLFVSGTILAIPGHVCYQIDTLLYLAVGEFPLKLAMDVAVEPSMVGWFVTLHHFWFLPVCFYVMLRGRMRVTKQHTLLACAMISVLRALTKLYLPSKIRVGRRVMSININMVGGVNELVNVPILGASLFTPISTLSPFTYHIASTGVYCAVATIASFLLNVALARLTPRQKKV